MDDLSRKNELELVEIKGELKLLSQKKGCKTSQIPVNLVINKWPRSIVYDRLKPTGTRCEINHVLLVLCSFEFADLGG